MQLLRDVKPLVYRLLFILLLFAFITDDAQAKVFHNSYVSFQLPPQWDCKLENTAWVCRYDVSPNCQSPANSSKKCKAERKRSKEAIIILTAKEVGDRDKFETYSQHLNTPRSIKTRKGLTASSQVMHVKAVSIANQKWVDGMHLSSEIPHYYTRYLATIKGRIAVLVTFSAHKLYYTRYSNDFFAAIKSLRVVANKVDTMRAGEPGTQTSTGALGANLSTIMNGEDEDAFLDENGGEEGSSSSLLFFAAFVLAALGVYIWIKGRQ